jgi:hypothetical protein
MDGPERGFYGLFRFSVSWTWILHAISIADLCTCNFATINETDDKKEEYNFSLCWGIHRVCSWPLDDKIHVRKSLSVEELSQI